MANEFILNWNYNFKERSRIFLFSSSEGHLPCIPLRIIFNKEKAGISGLSYSYL